MTNTNQNASNQAQLAGMLAQVLTDDQVQLLRVCFQSVLDHRFGTITFRVNGDRVFIEQALSFDGGKSKRSGG